MDNANYIHQHPFFDKESQSEKDYWTIIAMDTYGGSFVKALANLTRCADDNNLAKIKFQWFEYFKQYEEMGQILKNKEGKIDA